MDPISPELLARLPRTFAPALNEQVRSWDVLFPAERRTINAQLGWLSKLPGPEFQKLFEPLSKLESRMDLPTWTPDTARVSINDTGVLVRSPYYPQWRAEVEKVFTTIDSGVKASSKTADMNRALVCVMPAGLTLPPGVIWPSLETQGRWIPLEQPFGELLPGLWSGIAVRAMPHGLEPVECTWFFEYARGTPAADAAVRLSFDELAGVRREFLSRINLISRDLRKADRVYEELRHCDLRPWLGSGARRDVSEFIRNLFLSGNGAVLFGNSFVEWGAAEAMRRVQPQVLCCSFGVRPKLKPFSSVVLFEDQHRANPTPDEPDPGGSFVDCRILAEYVYFSAIRNMTSPDRMLAVFAIPELNRLLALGNDAALPPAEPKRPLSGQLLLRSIYSWLS